MGLFCIIVNHLYYLLAYKHPCMFCGASWRFNSSPHFGFQKNPSERYKFIILVISLISIGIFFNSRHETSVIKHFAGDIRTTESFLPENQFLTKVQTLKRPWIANKLFFGWLHFFPCFSIFSSDKDY